MRRGAYGATLGLAPQPSGSSWSSTRVPLPRRSAARGRLTTIWTMAMKQDDDRRAPAPPSGTWAKKTVRSAARREALRDERQRDRLPAVHLDRFEATRMREPRRVGDEDHAAEPERVEHGVGAVRVSERIDGVDGVGEPERREARPRARSTWARRASPSGRAHRAWRRRGWRRRADRRSRPRRPPSECVRVLRRRFQEERDPRRDHDEHDDQAVDPAVKLETRDAVAHQEHQRRDQEWVPGEPQRRRRSWRPPWGSPRKAQMVSPSAHSRERRLRRATTRRGCARNAQAPTRHKQRGQPLAAQHVAHASRQVWIPSPPRPTRPWTARPTTTARRGPTKRMRTDEPGHAVVPHRERAPS